MKAISQKQQREITGGCVRAYYVGRRTWLNVRYECRDWWTGRKAVHIHPTSGYNHRTQIEHFWCRTNP